MICGASEPSSMPMIEAKKPTRFGGTMASGATVLAASHVPMPRMIENNAPCVDAFFQYAPATSGMKAPASVTL